jgi:uncharacterized protein YijF (DUF1287 family)
MHKLGIAVVAIVVLASIAGCSSSPEKSASASTQPAQSTPAPTRRLISDIPEVKKVVDCAIEQTRQTIQYHPSYLIVHNIGAGARIEDVLMSWKIIGHYRMWK